MTTQPRHKSIIETAADVGIGFCGAMLLTHFVLPIWGYEPTLRADFEITMTYTVWALVRKYAVRRFFA